METVDVSGIVEEVNVHIGCVQGLVAFGEQAHTKPYNDKGI
jgi:hypothetical protein